MQMQMIRTPPSKDIRDCTPDRCHFLLPPAYRRQTSGAIFAVRRTVPFLTFYRQSEASRPTANYFASDSLAGGVLVRVALCDVLYHMTRILYIAKSVQP
jgi:hypothetical protein